MPFRRPLLLFDTNVARALRDRAPDDLRRFWAWVQAHHRYAIAPTVVAEVLNSLRHNAERNIEPVRRELSALRGPGRPIVLPLQRVFLGKTLFGIDREHPHLPAKTVGRVLDIGRKLIRVERLNDGRVLLVGKNEPEAIILNHIVEPIIEGQERMRAALGATKASQVAPLEREEWAKRVLDAFGLPSNTDAVGVVARACSAAYVLQRFLWIQAAGRYRPEKHPGDWLDGQLLLYLAYDSTVLISREKQLPIRIAGSGQEERVESFDELWQASQSAGSGTS